MSRLRTFIAVNPGKAVRDRLLSLQETLARTGTEVKWVEPENLHVTLLFLGEVQDRVVPQVCRVVEECTRRHPAFVMSVEGAGCFPNARRPRVLWVGIGEGAPVLCALHDDLEDQLLDLGCYRREERKFTPHLTLGRVKSEGPVEKLAAALSKQAGWKGGQVTIREILVMSSELNPDGPRYTVLSRVKMGGDPKSP